MGVVGWQPFLRWILGLVYYWIRRLLALESIEAGLHPFLHMAELAMRLEFCGPPNQEFVLPAPTCSSGSSSGSSLGDDKGKLPYRPDFFHLVFLLASAYLAMIFTG